MSPPRRPQICPICGEPGDPAVWCDKCASEFDDLWRDAGGRTAAEWAAKRGRNFERLRNHKKAVRA